MAMVSVRPVWTVVMVDLHALMVYVSAQMDKSSLKKAVVSLTFSGVRNRLCKNWKK